MMSNAKYFPWLDRKGRLSPLKLAVFIALFVPGSWTAFDFVMGNLGARPLNEANHETGLWTIRLLFLSLTISPARMLLQWTRLILVRRMIGVAVFIYAGIHLLIYVADQSFDLWKVTTEIALRIYLTIGLVGLIGLAALAATSTDGMIRRLGSERWNRLHQLSYGIAALGTIHFFLQQKDDVTEPTMMAGLLFWLMAYRVIARAYGNRAAPFWAMLALSCLAGLLTMLGEAGYFWWKIDVDPLTMLAANFSWDFGMRPAWPVLYSGLLLSCAGAARTLPAWAKLRLRPA